MWTLSGVFFSIVVFDSVTRVPSSNGGDFVNGNLLLHLLLEELVVVIVVLMNENDVFIFISSRACEQLLVVRTNV